MLYFSVKKYGEGMMLIWYKTNLGVGNTMVPSEIAKYIIINSLRPVGAYMRPFFFSSFVEM